MHHDLDVVGVIALIKGTLGVEDLLVRSSSYVSVGRRRSRIHHGSRSDLARVDDLKGDTVVDLGADLSPATGLPGGRTLPESS
jgi:hypothetical protein